VAGSGEKGEGAFGMGFAACERRGDSEEFHGGEGVNTSHLDFIVERHRDVAGADDCEAVQSQILDGDAHGLFL